MEPQLKPFIFAALIKKRPSPGIETQGTRGGVLFGVSADAVRGIKTADFLADGYSIEILEVEPMSESCIASIQAAPHPHVTELVEALTNLWEVIREHKASGGRRSWTLSVNTPVAYDAATKALAAFQSQQEGKP